MAILNNDVGAYQEFYQDELISYESSSNISWIGSLQAFLLIFGIVVCGPAFDLGHARGMIILGSLLVVFGMMMTSVSHEYWQFLLSQGLVVGMGNACLFLPSVAILPAYFTRRRALAMGISAAGGTLYDIVFHLLQPHIGFGWTTRIIAFIILGLQVLPLSTLKQRSRPPRVRRIWDSSALTEISFIAHGCTTFFAFAGFYIPFFYVQGFAQKAEIISGKLNFYLLALINAGSFVGRIIFPYVADAAGVVNTVIPSLVLTAVVCFSWIGVASQNGLLAFSVLYGFFSGAFIALNSAVIVLLCPDLSVLGTRMGMLAIPMSLGLLVGTPIAGSLLHSGYLSLQLFCGATVVVAILTTVITRVGLKGFRILIRI
ncbi:MAG: hypothetical protein Q9159_004698 [Coniocarpon cinnabarinum]